VQYKGTKKPLPEIAKALRVDAIVEGALLQSGDRVKATVRLIHAPRERPIWSQSYDHPARGVIGLQSEMALDLVAKARAALTNQELSLIKSSRSVDPEAYRQFLLGRHHCRDLLPESTRKGVAELETAIAKDPGFADAHAELASCGISIDRATSEVHAALALDPSNARAYSVRGGQRLTFEWDWPGAEADLKRAIELAPSDDAALCQYALYLTAMKRYDEALQAVERAIELNPTDSRIYDFYGSWAAIMAGRFELALQYSRRSHDVNPEADSPFLLMCYSLVKLGRIPEATTAFLRLRQRWPEKQDNLTDAWLFHYYVAAGRRAEAERIVDYWSSQPEDSVDPANLFTMHAMLGRAEKALDYLELAYEKRSGSMFLLQAGEDDSPIAVRKHPRYLAILKKMNFPK
jgi:tetratricopeptide (TPR) repeat protein